MNKTMNRSLSDEKLEQLRLAVGLHYSYGCGDLEEKGLRFRLKRFLRVFGVPLADTVTDRQALAAAAAIWEKYVPAVRVAIFGSGPQVTIAFSRRHDDPADALFVLAVAVQAEDALQCIAKERLTEEIFQPLWKPAKPD